MSADAVARVRLAEAADSGDLPKAYFEHPMVRARASTEPPLLPIALFIDGVPYSQTDSVVGFWIVNLISGRRHLCAVLRKKLTCACSCKGWCTFHAVFKMIAWSLGVLLGGRFPAHRHDGAPFGANDATRAAKAGAKMSYKAVVLFVKGDWSEYATTLGFPSWRDSLRPCFACNAAGGVFNEYAGVSLRSVPWRNNTPGDYDAACRRCEIVVTLSADTFRLVLARLFYDKRADGSRGRSLSSQVAELGLQAGDRLEPGLGLNDIGQFEQLSDFPVDVLFWRPSMETLTRHRNPIFGPVTQLQPELAMTIDTLHVLYLGVIAVYNKHVVWEVLSMGLWGYKPTGKETLEHNVLCFKNELFRWYRQREQSVPEPKLTRLQDFSLKMVGEASHPKLKTKGAENWGLLLFLIHLLQEKGRQLGPHGGVLLEAGQSLRLVCDIIDSHGVRMPADAVQQCLDAWKRHMALVASIDSMAIPKRHLVFHMILSIPFLGNPKFASNWQDETLNKLLKKACREISQATFEPSVLLSMQELLKTGEKRRYS